MHIVLLHFYSHTPTPAYQEIASALRARGHTVWVGSRDRKGNLAWQDGERTIASTTGPVEPPAWLAGMPLLGSLVERCAFLGFMRRVRASLREGMPEVVQVNHASVRWLGFLPLFMPQEMRFVLDFRQVGQRGAKDPAGRLKGSMTDWWRRVCSRKIYDCACFLHPAGAAKLLGKDWQKWGVVVPLGVGRRFLSVKPAEAGQAGGVNPVRFLYIGTLSRVRHLEQILDAVKEVLPATRDFRVDFVGTDSAQGFYHDLISKMGLEAVVRVRQPVPYQDVAELMAGYDVALAYVPDRPAHWLYHPTMKILEYRAVGLPILASDNEPNRDLVQDGENGLLVQNTPGSLAEGISRFVLDRAFLESCKAKAQEMRRGETWDDVARMYEQDVYQRLRN